MDMSSEKRTATTIVILIGMHVPKFGQGNLEIVAMTARMCKLELVHNKYGFTKLLSAHEITVPTIRAGIPN
jgi:hypothetical protein